MNLRFIQNAKDDFEQLQNDPSKKRILKDVLKTFAFMETNLRHPSLNTHEYKNFKGPDGEKVFTAYVQQKTSCVLIECFGIMGLAKIPFQLLPLHHIHNFAAAVAKLS
jgi:hypothetical protein